MLYRYLQLIAHICKCGLNAKTACHTFKHSTESEIKFKPNTVLVHGLAAQYFMDECHWSSSTAIVRQLRVFHTYNSFTSRPRSCTAAASPRLLV